MLDNFSKNVFSDDPFSEDVFSVPEFGDKEIKDSFECRTPGNLGAETEPKTCEAVKETVNIDRPFGENSFPGDLEKDWYFPVDSVPMPKLPLEGIASKEESFTSGNAYGADLPLNNNPISGFNPFSVDTNMAVDSLKNEDPFAMNFMPNENRSLSENACAVDFGQDNNPVGSASSFNTSFSSDPFGGNPFDI